MSSPCQALINLKKLTFYFNSHYLTIKTSEPITWRDSLVTRQGMAWRLWEVLMQLLSLFQVTIFVCNHNLSCSNIRVSNHWGFWLWDWNDCSGDWESEADPGECWTGRPGHPPLSWNQGWWLLQSAANESWHIGQSTSSLSRCFVVNTNFPTFNLSPGMSQTTPCPQ